MCITLNSIKDCPKVAESDMITYKVLEVVEDETTGKESYYSPFSSNKLQYNIGELYTEPLGKTEDSFTVYDMVGGFEKYTCANTTTGLYSFKSDRGPLVTWSLLWGTSNIKYKLFRCKVPKGSKYYDSDEDGDTEIVSDNLVILSQVDLESDNS